MKLELIYLISLVILLCVIITFIIHMHNEFKSISTKINKIIDSNVKTISIFEDICKHNKDIINDNIMLYNQNVNIIGYLEFIKSYMIRRKTPIND